MDFKKKLLINMNEMKNIVCERVLFIVAFLFVIVYHTMNNSTNGAFWNRTWTIVQLKEETHLLHSRKLTLPKLITA